MENRYYIPQYLDEPTKLIIFTVDEFVAFMAPFILLFFFLDSIWLAVGVSSALVYGLKRVKGREGHYFLYQWLYWHFPLPQPGILRVTPPSHDRQWVS